MRYVDGEAASHFCNMCSKLNGQGILACGPTHLLHFCRTEGEEKTDEKKKSSNPCACRQEEACANKEPSIGLCLFLK
ncbi:hypothetical protein POVWA2_040780 [Plasmodium ovale wallikeri]|uniref:Uncharacterized protein n=1 Tax=Plasmodium ovale wallikeri TaxID=864142 RepID=A0A1A8ZAD8_PLAOA|nr:hypothetical protein POVWA1_042270 [Plasmodium ovale wallikeri]SBT40933.1 hypothetical protein POVWA2_040780 [Plasmodium ovale wallikeri]